MRDETLDNNGVFVVERYPAYKYSGYTKQIAWVDKFMYQPRKVEYYDRKNTLLKTMVLTEYQQYLDTYWRAGRMDMTNHQTNKETTMEWSNYQFQNNLTKRDFDKNTLKRAR